MPDFEPVDYDPFATQSPPLKMPVDQDPFAGVDPATLRPAGYQQPGAAASGVVSKGLVQSAYDNIIAPLVSLGKLGTGQSDAPTEDLGSAIGAIGLPGKALFGKGLAMIAGAAAPKLGEMVAPRAGEALEAGIKAYHGSPHDFERFDMSKIGTGEGAQAYGHGLYFAERKGVAESYKTSLSSATVDKKSANQFLEETPKIDTVYDALRYLKEQGQSPTIEDAAKFLNSSPIPAERRVADAIHTYGSPENARRMMNKDDVPIFDKMVKEGRIEANPGHTYEVAIKAHPDEFLDWDKPLSEQHPKVQEALQNFAYPYKEKMTGKEWIDQAASYSRGSPGATSESAKERISERLRAAGIPGIKYLDQGSRGNAPTYAREVEQYENLVAKHQERLKADPGNQRVRDALAGDQAMLARLKDSPRGTRNYVVFDDNLIHVMKKYGIAGVGALPAAGAYHFKTQQADGDPYKDGS